MSNFCENKLTIFGTKRDIAFFMKEDLVKLPDPIEIEEESLFFNFETRSCPPADLLVLLSRLNNDLCFALSFAEEMPTRGRIFVTGGKIQDALSILERDNSEIFEQDFKTDNDYMIALGNWNYFYFRNHESWVASL